MGEGFKLNCCIYIDNNVINTDLLTLARNINQMFKGSNDPIRVGIPSYSQQEDIEAFKTEWSLFSNNYLKLFGYELIPITSKSGILINPRFYYNTGYNIVIKIESISDSEKQIEQVDISEAIQLMGKKDIQLNELLYNSNGLGNIPEYISKCKELFT